MMRIMFFLIMLMLMMIVNVNDDVRHGCTLLYGIHVNINDMCVLIVFVIIVVVAVVVINVRWTSELQLHSTI